MGKIRSNGFIRVTCHLSVPAEITAAGRWTHRRIPETRRFYGKTVFIPWKI